MIQRIKVENYKSIRSLELHIGRFNVFIGENGGGKTNLLEAVALGSAMIDDAALQTGFLAMKGVRITDESRFFSGFKNTKNADQSILVEFSNGQYQYPLNIIWEEDPGYWFLKEVPLEMDHSYKELAKNFPQSVEALLALVQNAKLKRAEQIHATTIPNFVIYAPENYFLRRFEEEAQIRPLGTRGEGLFSHLTELSREKPTLFKKIQKHLEWIDWYDGFEIPNDLVFSERRLQIQDRYLAEGIQFIDQRSSNEGFLYLLFYLTLFISDATPRFFAIDNIDNALNPKLCTKLIEVLTQLAKEHDKQVLMTAHNPAILDGLDISNPDHKLFVLSRNAEGHTRAREIHKKPTPLGTTPTKLSELFMRGSLGGLPTNF